MGIKPITQEKAGFRLGDRVRFIDSADPDNGVTYGQTGVICSLDPDYGDDCVGVEWDVGKSKYHECSGKCRNYHGWWVPLNLIERVCVDIGEIEASEFGLDMLFDVT